MLRNSVLAGILALLLQGTCAAAATQAPPASTDSSQPAAQTVTTTATAAPADKTDTKTEDVQKKPVVVNRYVKIFQDNSYSYLMDMQTARWITCPHTAGEQILDVWIKLDSMGGTTDDSTQYSYPGKYYLEHYYIRPDKQQIQFLSELEVTGRPSNAIQERSYNAANWENLVPGSIEEEIYHAVVKNAYTLVKQKQNAKTEARDALEELLRISL